MLTDTYLYFLRFFPEQFDFEERKFGKIDILAANLAVDLIQQQVERDAIQEAYGDFRKQLRRFLKKLDISDPEINQELSDRIVEVKETRNLVLHNNLRMNSMYEAKAGRFRRQADSTGRLVLPQAYVIEACQNVQALVQEIQARLSSKYVSYTRLAALKRLWEYIFSSPIMPFEEFWSVDEAKDEVVAIKQSPYEKEIAKSERLFLSVWRAHFNGWRDAGGHMLMYSLDSRNRQKMLWLLATLVDFDVR